MLLSVLDYGGQFKTPENIKKNVLEKLGEIAQKGLSLKGGGGLEAEWRGKHKKTGMWYYSFRINDCDRLVLRTKENASKEIFYEIVCFQGHYDQNRLLNDLKQK